MLEILAAKDLPVRWITANAAHLTLQFIGEVPVESAQLLRMAFGGISQGTSQISLAIDGAGAFPNLNKPQIIWLGLTGDVVTLRRLNRSIETFLLGFDFVPEQREFKPHITLGRARDKLQSPETNALIEAMRSKEVKAQIKALEAPFTVDHVTLFRSHMSHEGATYEKLATARLG